jgi:hypothetical protein
MNNELKQKLLSLINTDPTNQDHQVTLITIKIMEAWYGTSDKDTVKQAVVTGRDGSSTNNDPRH